MVKLWIDKGDGTYKSTNTLVLQRTTIDELLLRKFQPQNEIPLIQSAINSVDADILSIDVIYSNMRI